MLDFSQTRILIRGAGEIASATAISLRRVGFPVIMTELANPLSIRQTVCFSEAMLNGDTSVEGIHAIKTNYDNYINTIEQSIIPILIDSIATIKKINPDYYIDARMLKKDIVDNRSLGKFTIGLGPGFSVNENCDVIIETMRGHNLGKIIRQGSAQSNTGIPGKIGGESSKRVIWSNSSGKIDWLVNIGDLVKANQIIGSINETKIKSKLDGMVRGLISPSVNVINGMKIADVDPRGELVNYNTISDKSRCIGRGVLEAILMHINQ